MSPEPILLPEPPLTDGAVTLRPWRTGDAPALVAAWADPEVRRWTAVPPRTDLAYAERWIAGSAERRRGRLAIDLVITPADRGDGEGTVLGEVSLAWTLGDSERAAIGWWVAAEARGGGVASRAVHLLADWALGPLGLVELVADIDQANEASPDVAHRAGLRADPPGGDRSGLRRYKRAAGAGDPAVVRSRDRPSDRT